MMLTIWRIALPTPVAHHFDYLPPAVLPEKIRPGLRVRVPFGARQLLGILLTVVHETEIPFGKLKSVQEVLDQEPVFTAQLLKICYWVSDYYHYSMGEVLMTALPKRLREGKAITPKKLMPVPTGQVESLTLNPHQEQALNAILNAKQFQCFLLAGVTGSGKTEVYLQAIAAILSRGKQALVLVPEIGLTPQTVLRMQERLPVRIAVFHSRLTPSEQAQMWYQAKNGEASVVIGTRSAIFAPLPSLGLIIVDEEHDASFKSQSGVRYSARDIAVMRGYQEKIPVVLGSATPRLETYYNAVRQRYTLLNLPLRAGKAVLPLIRVLDLCKQKLTAGLSAALIAAIQAQLAKGKQVLLFINRRGYAPVMLCHQCGYIVVCTRCDAKLTYHATPARLICHHCEKVEKPKKVCPQCHQADLIMLGQGTEQIEEALTKLFPKNTILRIDRDTTKKKNSLDEKLTQINDCKADILVGTQMLAKGHHFTNLGLSAILDMDSAFFSIDFRAIEQMAQLLVQVSGRAGRGEEIGAVLIQTHYPEHPYLQLILRGDYFLFLDTLLKERKAANLPPFCHHVLIRAEAKEREKSIAFLQQTKEFFSQNQVEALGPMPALLERKAGRFRQQLLVCSNSRVKLQEVLQPLMKEILKLPAARAVRWSIDVDPIDSA